MATARTCHAPGLARKTICLAIFGLIVCKSGTVAFYRQRMCCDPECAGSGRVERERTRKGGGIKYACARLRKILLASSSELLLSLLLVRQACCLHESVVSSPLGSSPRAALGRTRVRTFRSQVPLLAGGRLARQLLHKHSELDSLDSLQASKWR